MMSPEPTRDPSIDRRAVVTALEQLRASARLLLLMQRLGLILAAVIGSVIVLGLIDYLVRLPWGFRLAVWALGLGLIAWAVRRWVAPAWRFKPSLVDVALRLERTDEAHVAGLSGLLASGLELGDGGGGETVTARMSRAVFAEAATKFKTVRASAVLDVRQTRRALFVLGGALCASALVSAAASPTLARIGAVRTLVPWASVDWPKRTGVVDVTQASVHPLGTTLVVRAAVTKTPAAEGQTPVSVRYRVLAEGVDASVRRGVLSGQFKTIEAVTAAGTVSGELYERLIEPGELGGVQSAAMAASGGVRGELEYWFTTADDQTEPVRIKLVEPPAVESARVTVEPPSYARSGGRIEGFADGEQALGAGSDERALVRGVLGGSAVGLRVLLNKAVPVPTDDEVREAGTVLRAWLGETLGVDSDGLSGLSVRFPGPERGRELELAWTATESVRIEAALTDEFGLASREEAAFSIEVTADGPPTATVTEPAQDESVLPTASVRLVGEGRDDVGLDFVSLTSRVAAPAAGSEGGVPEAAGEMTQLVRAGIEPAAGGERQRRVEHALELEPLGLTPGQELWVYASARDVFVGADGLPREPVLSLPRRLRIISEAQLVESLRAGLESVRESAIRLDADQRGAMAETERAWTAGQARGQQAGVGERADRQEQALRELEARAERNRLGDEAVREQIAEAAEAMRSATAASGRASAALDRAAQRGGEPTAQERSEVEDAQQDVRDELGRLIESLDRGQDSWVARRQIEKLLDEQRAVRAATAQLGEQTGGKTPEQLTPQERRELEQAADRQQDLARRAGQAIQTLTQRSRDMQQSDPAAAGAMAQAAQRGREQRVEDRLEQAAQAVRENRTQNAGQEQREAISALEQMLSDMQQSSQQRDERLRRVLADLVRSLRGLIEEQRTQLARLDGEAAGLDAGMIALRQNTLGVEEQARQGGRETAGVGRLIGRAGEAQEKAIVALRAAPVEVEAARAGEKESLTRLEEALAEAQRLAEQARQRDQTRQRQQLRAAYREALETQVALRSKAEEAIGKELDRRARAGVRQLGDEQESLRAAMATLKDENEEIGQTDVFAYAHERLDLVMGDAGKTLRAGQATPKVKRDQDSAVRVLQSLVAALDESQRRADEFREQAQEDGGGGGGSGGEEQPLIPPIAELRGLREMQQDALERTRGFDDARDAGEAVTERDLEQIVAMQTRLAEMGAKLVEKLREQQQRGGPPGGQGGGEPGPQMRVTGFAVQDGQAQSGEKPAAPGAQPRQPRPRRTLDDLLGLPGGAKPAEKPADGAVDPKAGGAKPADPARAALDRKLALREASEQFQQAVQLMSETAARMSASGDTSIQTQRVQEDIIRKLDMMISAAQQQESQSSSSSSSSSQSQGQQQQEQQPNQAQGQGEERGEQRGGDGQAQTPPGRRDGALGPTVTSQGAAWGALPARVREALTQGASDRFSSLYERMTEEYYRRLAEERKP